MRTKRIYRLERLIATAGARFPGDCVRTLVAWRVAPEMVVGYERYVNNTGRAGGARCVDVQAELIARGRVFPAMLSRFSRWHSSPADGILQKIDRAKAALKP